MGAAETSVDDHLGAVLALSAPLPVVTSSPDAAVGRMLAADVLAPGALPPFDNAAMDGFALRHKDFHGTPLRVSGAGAAGSGLPPQLVSGTAWRIMTGAPIPGGADVVVAVEDTDGGRQQVQVHRLPPLGANIRRAGGDLAAAAVALTAGTSITPARVALLAALGVTQVLVHRTPVVVVVATGDELVPTGQPLPPGGIYESNATMLAALAAGCGAKVHVVPTLTDDPVAAVPALQDAAATADLLITAGGISAGDHEVVKLALSPCGTVHFGPVAMTPGRPQGRGMLAGTPVLTFPGNPVGAFVSFILFAAPVIARLNGGVSPPWRRAPLADPFRPHPARVGIHPARWDTAVTADASHHLSALARADALVRVDPGHAVLPAGTTLPVFWL